MFHRFQSFLTNSGLTSYFQFNVCYNMSRHIYRSGPILSHRILTRTLSQLSDQDLPHKCFILQDNHDLTNRKQDPISRISHF